LQRSYLSKWSVMKANTPWFRSAMNTRCPRLLSIVTFLRYRRYRQHCGCPRFRTGVRRQTKLYLVEVKYQTKFDIEEIKKFAATSGGGGKVHGFFVATRDAFYCAPCSSVVQKGVINELTVVGLQKNIRINILNYWESSKVSVPPTTRTRICVHNQCVENSTTHTSYEEHVKVSGSNYDVVVSLLNEADKKRLDRFSHFYYWLCKSKDKGTGRS